jgi:adenine-specific DNA-methyltransferase
VAEAAARMRGRLENLGYRASTGPLVWNRVKPQLRARAGAGTYPLIWAEAVRPNAFSFEYRARLDRSFVKVEPGQEHLLTARPCVLVQRTTAKEQRRRLIACAVPDSFLADWEAVVIENHVNVLWASGSGHVPPIALAAVLNTLAVDQVFRSLSGSVAVSATELHALPLPSRAVFEEIGELMAKPLRPAARERAVEELVAEAYGIRWSSLLA